MSSHTGWRRISASVVLALLSGVLLVTPAFAEEAAPPADVVPPEESALPAPLEPEVLPLSPVEGQTVSDPDPAAETAPSVDPALDGTPFSADTALAVGASVGGAPLGLLDGIPDGTTVTVADAEGEALPLAAVAAAQILATGDPVWCPKDVMPGQPLCSPSFPSLAALVAGFVPNNNGVIWIQGGADTSSGGVVISGSGNWAAAASHNLALRGGWGGPGTTTTDPDNPTVFSTGLTIVDWNAEVKIHDIVINAAPGEIALVVTSAGPIELARVRVEGNGGAGARLDNTSGTANLIVRRSQFSGNGGGGLTASSRGTITLSGVMASGNGGTGAVLDNSGAPSAKAVLITTGNEFSDNAGDGSQIHSRGSVTLKDITAVGNDGNGAFIDNSAGTGTVALTGVNVLSGNGQTGLRILSRGAIAGSSIVANANGSFGAELENAGAAISAPITLTGINEFKFNGSGLSILSTGAITLSNVSASGNTSGLGAYLRNDYPGFSGNVRLSGANIFDDNEDYGLWIDSAGSIAARVASASRNGHGTGTGWGAWIDNSGSASARTVVLNGPGQFSGNYLDGLMIDSRGAVSLGSVTAGDSSHGSGAIIDNTYGTADLPQNVTLSGANTFSGNYSDGLSVESLGIVTIANLTASGNGAGGAGHGARVVNSGAATAKAVTLSGMSRLEGNLSGGLMIDSRGVITVNNLLASGNGGDGAYLHNRYAGVLSAVAVNGTSEFGGNGLTGLTVFSRGNITLQNFEASGNGDIGVVLDNRDPGTAANVVVGTSKVGWCNAAWGNHYSGMEVHSYGSVTLSSICAQANGDDTDPDPEGDGVYVDNTGAAPGPGVLLKGTNRFDGNFGSGLVVHTGGPVVSSGLSAEGNLHGYGVYLDNTSSGTALPQMIKLTGANSFEGNWLSGLEAYSYGAITLGSLTANGNGVSGSGDGACLENDPGIGATAKAITLSGSSVFLGNSGRGLYAVSLGAITVNGLTAGGNGSDGARLDNQFGLLQSAVVLTRANTFEENFGSGLVVLSNGPITLSSVTATGNGGDGAFLDTRGLTSAQKVTLAGSSSFNENGDTVMHTGNGLEVWADGQITISNLSAGRNADSGALLDNLARRVWGAPGITLTGTSAFAGNFGDGLTFDAYGTVSLSKLTADGNGSSGLEGTTGGNVVLMCGSMTANGDYGWYLASPGVVTLKGVFSYGNGTDSPSYPPLPGGGTLVVYRACN